MVRTVPPSSRNFFSCGTVDRRGQVRRAGRDTGRPRPGRSFAAGAAGLVGPVAAAAPAAAGPPRPRRPRRPGSARRTSSRRSALVQLRRVDDLERELELLQEPAGPARRHRPAVAVPQADAGRLERHGLRARARSGCPGTACRARRRSSPAAASVVGLARDEERARRVASTPPTANGCLQPADLLARLLEPVHGPERVVQPGAEEEARRRPRRRGPGPAGAARPAPRSPRTGRRSRRGRGRTSRPSGRPGCSRPSRRAGSAGRRDRRSRWGGPAARTCRARGRGTPGRVFTT